jgi:hypothetical protein
MELISYIDLQKLSIYPLFCTDISTMAENNIKKAINFYNAGKA